MTNVRWQGNDKCRIIGSDKRRTIADWALGHASRDPAEKYRQPVNKENVVESLRYKADESRGEGA